MGRFDAVIQPKHIINNIPQSLPSVLNLQQPVNRTTIKTKAICWLLVYSSSDAESSEEDDEDCLLRCDRNE